MQEFDAFEEFNFKDDDTIALIGTMEYSMNKTIPFNVACVDKDDSWGEEKFERKGTSNS